MPRRRALAERGGRLYLAGSNYSDGWSLAVSTDEGRTIQPSMHYDQVGGAKAWVMAGGQGLCDEQAGRRIWGPGVCNPSPNDGGSGDAGDGGDAGPPAQAPSGCGSRAAAPRGGGAAA